MKAAAINALETRQSGIYEIDAPSLRGTEESTSDIDFRGLFGVI